MKLLCVAIVLACLILGYRLSRDLAASADDDPFGCDDPLCGGACPSCGEDLYINSGGLARAPESLDFALWEVQVGKEGAS